MGLSEPKHAFQANSFEERRPPIPHVGSWIDPGLILGALRVGGTETTERTYSQKE